MNENDHEIFKSLNGHQHHEHKQPVVEALEHTVPRGSRQHYDTLESRLLALLDSQKDSQQKDDQPMNIAIPQPPRRNTTSFSYTMAAALVAVFFGVVTMMFLRQVPPDSPYGSMVFQTDEATATLIPTEQETLPPTYVPTSTPIDSTALPPTLPPMVCYAVQEGDTGQRIAEQFNLTMRDLAGFNPELCGDGACSRMTIGDCLYIPAPPNGYYQHTVQPGESLFMIVAQYGYRNPDAIGLVLTANPELSSADDISVGQVLMIPVPTGTGLPVTNLDATATPVPFNIEPTVIPLATATPLPLTSQPGFMMPTVIPPDGGGLLPVVVAVMDLPANHELGSISRVMSIRTVYYPADLVPPDAFSDELEVIGRFSRQPIKAFQPITEGMTSETRLSTNEESEQYYPLAIPLEKLEPVDASQGALEEGMMIHLATRFDTDTELYYMALRIEVVEVTADEVTVTLPQGNADIVRWVMSTPQTILYEVYP